MLVPDRSIRNEVLVQADDGEALTRRELACVAAEATTPGISEESLYLNDSVINFYLVLVRRRLRNPRIVIFSDLQ